MSLYNILHGVNEITPLLLKILDLQHPTFNPKGKWNCGRFRDIYLNDKGTEIILYTRNGGGNREHWDDEIVEGPGCKCTGCIITYHLPNHENYIRDYDDDSDCTYAYLVFAIPDRCKELAEGLATGKSPTTIGEKFKDIVKEMEQLTPKEISADKRVKPLTELTKKIVDTVDKNDNP